MSIRAARNQMKDGWSTVHIISIACRKYSFRSAHPDATRSKLSLLLSLKFNRTNRTWN